MSLAEVLAQHRVVVTVGSGGVGKTTTAAALALHAASQGKRVLCLTIDPARRLANSMGLEEMRMDEQEIDPAIAEAAGVPMKGSLSAMMLDTKRTFDELVRNYASSEESAERILKNKIYQYVAGGLAGTQEYMAMEKLFEVRKDPQWDLIVLDTPPTANALDFLDAPERLVGAIDSPAMRWFLQAYESAGKGAFGALVGKGAGLLLQALSKFTGMEFLEQVAEFVGGINELFGGFKDRATQVSSALRSPDVTFVVVTSPSPLAIREAHFFSQKLIEAGMKRDAVVVNGVHQLLAEPNADDAAIAEAFAPHLPTGADSGDVVEKMWQALEDERLQAVADRIESDRLKNQLGDDAGFVEVPAFEEDVHDLRALSRVAQHLVGAVPAS